MKVETDKEHTEASGEDIYVFPLAFAQQRLWLLDQIATGSPAYNITAGVRLRGRLDLNALRRSFDDLARRHETLRTTFDLIDESPVQIISEAKPVALPVIEIDRLHGDAGLAEVQRLSTEEARKPFDLQAGPLWRATLLRLAPQEHVLLLTVHHIIADGWSMKILIRDLTAIYESYVAGTPLLLPELPVQYADYAHWQRQHLHDTALAAQLDYWRHQLSALPSALALPADHPRPAVQRFHGSSLTFTLGSHLTRSLYDLSRSSGVTLFMTLLAGFELLLMRHSGQWDVAVGTPVAGRAATQVEDLIGLFANTVVIRGRAGGSESFAELVESVREACLGAYAHQEVPFERLVEELAAGRDTSRNPLFQVMFVLQNTPSFALQVSGLTIEEFEVNGGISKFDLTLSMWEESGALHGRLEYNTDIFEEATAQRLAARFALLLSEAAAHPQHSLSRLPLLPPQERQLLLSDWNQTQAAYPTTACLHELFEQQVARTPSATALRYEEETVTYAELNARANRLAHHLREQGVGVESLVGLCVERSVEMVVGLLGILKAGAAYVPLDPEYPRERLAFMLADAGVQVLLTQQRLLDTLPACDVTHICLDSDREVVSRQSTDNLPPVAASDNLAYVIYTSGSTGRPKGVSVTHANVARLFSSTRRWFGFDENDTWTLFHSSAFDFSVWEIWGALLHGGRLVIVPYIVTRSPREFYELLGREAVTVLNQTPSAFKQLCQSEEEAAEFVPPLSLRLVIFGGEALEAGALRDWFERHGDERPRLVNMYGITETTVHVTYYELSRQDAWDRRGSVIGVPLGDMQAYVLDEGWELTPIGVAGELYVGGGGLARGYLGRPELSAERFIPHPFSETGGARLYRTGDLARYLPDGKLEYLGRADRQVKLRGFRIELGEIESVLLDQESVREVAVLPQETAPGEQRLVAYVVSNGDAPAHASVLRDHLRSKLPDYMIPAVFVPLNSLPLTPNGKIDHASLPVAGCDREREEAYVPPRNPVEEMIAGVWVNLLGVGRVGVEEDFFLLGGHSLLATRLVSRLRNMFRVELTMRELFEQPTVGALAACVERLRLDGRLTTAPPVEPVPRDAPVPLSFSQQRLWFIDQLEPGSALYNISGAVRLSGALDVDVLRRTLNEVVRRHESLRTNFDADAGHPFQLISASLDLQVPLVDVSRHTQPQLEALRLADEERWRPFDLRLDALIRAALLKLGAREHVLILTMHHIVSDGWSIKILIRELAALYRAFSQGEPSPLPDLAIQYADYAHWQQRWLQGDALEEQVAYWRRQLGGLPTLDLPTDRTRPAVQSFHGAGEPLSLSQDVVEKLKSISRRGGATLFMTLLAAFQLLLARYSGQTDIVVGTPVAGRTRTELEALVGFFANTLVLRGRVSLSQSFLQLLADVRETTLAAYAHQETPFERLVEELQPTRDLSRNPLFQAMFLFQDEADETKTLELPDLALSALEVETRSAKYDLRLMLAATGEGLRGILEYNTDLFEPHSIGLMARHFSNLLQAVAADPEHALSRLPLLPPQERQLLLSDWNQTQAAYPMTACLHELFEQQVARTPSAVALRYEEETVTYAELNARANRLAHHLRELGAGVESLVGLCVERSVEMVVGLLGILKAGAAYVPVEASYPAERLHYMLADAGARLLVTQRSLADKLPDLPVRVVVIEGDAAGLRGENVSPPRNMSTPGNAAYVLYTSGSTGKPKGVVVEHRQVLNYTYGIIARTEMKAEMSFAMVQPLTVDSCNTIIYPQLLTGGCIHLISPERATDAQAFGEYMTRHRVNCLKIAPSHFSSLLKAPHTQSVMPRDRVVTGGETSYWDYMDAMLAENPDCRIFNHYGPTETTTGTVTYCVAAGAPRHSTPSVPIGRPLANVQLYVLDAHLAPVPLGARGEIYLGGDSVSRGYLNQPALTAERFIPDAFSATPGARLYRTGDVARYLPDAAVEFLGRVDHQVKVRGHRIELGEVEATLLEHQAVREAVALARDDGGGEKRLVAYVVAAEEGLLNVSDLRGFLSKKLPGHMLPSAFVLLPSLPRTPHGKIDLRALPPPESARPELDDAYVAPQTEMERTISRIWQDVLGLEKVGVYDNFFDLGGHSLLIMAVHTKLQEATRRKSIPLIELFHHPTVSALAAFLTRAGDEEPQADEDRVKLRRELTNRRRESRRRPQP